jgi:subtilisin family serine protease
LEAKNSQHGILCGEILHALAPDAQLLLANWDPDSPDEFLKAVRWAHQEGARILSCSLIMPSWSDGEGGGSVHAELSRLLTTLPTPTPYSPLSTPHSTDMLFFACAGNTAQRHWSGPFHNGGDGYHEWVAGQKDNELIPWTDEQISVELCWHAEANYDLQVLDRTTNSEAAKSLARTGYKRSCAVARFVPQAQHRYVIRVRLARGRPGPFHVVALGGALVCTTAKGSIPFPADGPEVIAVGAVSREGQRTPYSSCGPNSLQPKPDLTAPVPFPSQWRSQPFAGTSAAAPQAAALAALWWSRHPDWTSAQVRRALYGSARDLGPPGHDFETGYGMILMPNPAE